MFIDTHAHLYSEEFKQDVSEIVEKCQQVSVQKIFMPNIDHTSIEGMMELELKYSSMCISTMGLHPCYIKKDFEKELYIIEDWLSKRKFAAIGEIGLDFYWDTTFKSQQEEALKIQIQLANKYKLPIIIHCRNSYKETMEIIKAEKSDSLMGIFHCFSGTIEDANEIISIGFKMGIGGVVTFKKSGLDAVVSELNLSDIVLETDSPYLAPVPHRGKRNNPSYIPIIAEKIAELKKVTVEEVMNTTTTNAIQIFNSEQ